MKNICRSLLAFILFLIISGQTLIGVASAYDYTREFVEYYGLSSITSAKSPLRSATDNTIDVYSNVNSNNNQPRVINGSADVHNATDLRASAGTAVYAILNGYITYISEPSNTSNNGYVTIRHVVNGASYYVRYFHIDPDTSIAVGDYVTQSTKIATIDIAKSWPSHLDYGQKDASSTGKSLKLYPFYRWVWAWDIGSYLEWFSGDAHLSNNLFYINCVNSDTTGSTPCSSVKINYKISSGTSWNSKYLTQNSTASTRWNIDFDTLGLPGQSIHYYLVGTRSDNTTYYWGYFPQYYKEPNGPTLSNTYASTISRLYIIQ